MERDHRTRASDEQLARIRADLVHIKWILGGILVLLGVMAAGPWQLSEVLVWVLAGAVVLAVLYSILKFVENRVHQKTASVDAEARMQEIIAAYQAKEDNPEPKDDAWAQPPAATKPLNRE